MATASTPRPRGRVIVLNGASSDGKSTLGPFAWVGQMRPRFFDGFHRCIPAMAAAGNDLIVEHVVEFAGLRAQLDTLLEGFDVFWVAVHCGDGTPGEGRAHDHGRHDMHVDTTAGVNDTLVRTVIDGWNGARRPG